MELSEEDLKHVHKVLHSDVKECGIHKKGSSEELQGRLSERIFADTKILLKIEKIIGYKPEYEYSK